MTEFEKWWSKKGIIRNQWNYEEHAKNAWKAALEWVEDELDKARGGFEPDLGLRNLLKKELNGTSEKRG